MAELLLTGLDGTNPIGFMAALGTQQVCADRGIGVGLGWRLEDAWRPVLTAESADPDWLIGCLLDDLQQWRQDAPELSLVYEKQTKKGVEMVHDLKPEPGLFQSFAAKAVESAWRGARRWADYVAAYAAAHGKLGVQSNGSAKPTALHFCAGNQTFLDTVRELVQEVQAEDLREALLGPWRYERQVKLLGWDLVAGERDYALRATNPSNDKKAGVPGADWLAFRALPCFPTALVGGDLATTAFRGRGKQFSFQWLLWEPAVALSVARSLLALPDAERMSRREREARGIVMVLRSAVRRTDRGGYGSFSAPTVG